MTELTTDHVKNLELTTDRQNSKQQFSSKYKVVDNFGNIEECPSTFDSSLPPGGANGCWDKTGSNDQGENICSVPMASECLAMVFFTSKL